MSEISNRENFFTWMAIHTVSLLTIFIFFKIIFQSTSNINGWTEYQTLLVLGIASLITGLGSLTFFSFMYHFGLEIQKGEFDMKLVKPIDVHFLSSFYWVDFEDVIIIPNSLILIVYSLINLNPPYLLINFFVFILLILSSLVILFSALTLIQSLALKLVRVDSVANFFWSMVNISRYPTKAIRGISTIAAVLLAPVALISSVPAEVLFGRFEPVWILTSLISAVILFILSRRVFMSALRHYSSASS